MRRFPMRIAVGITGVVLLTGATAVAPSSADSRPAMRVAAHDQVRPVAKPDRARAVTSTSPGTRAATSPQARERARQRIQHWRGQRLFQVARINKMRKTARRVALAQVGDSYVAAAAGPRAFDCSGLTKYVYGSAFGRSLPHYSYAQWRLGRRVSVREALPGDLVFYFGHGAHHVGLYVGHGLMVHAANPESGVKVSGIFDSEWYQTRFSGIRRVVELPRRWRASAVQHLR